MSVSLKNSYVGILMYNVVVLERGAFRRCLGHEDGALMSVIKEIPQSTLDPSIM